MIILIFSPVKHTAHYQNDGIAWYWEYYGKTNTYMYIFIKYSEHLYFFSVTNYNVDMNSLSRSWWLVFCVMLLYDNIFGEKPLKRAFSLSLSLSLVDR